MKLRDKNKIPFWKEVRRVKGTHKNVLTCIDGKTDTESITQLFDARYKEFLSYSDDHEGSSMSNPSQHSSNMQHGSPVISLKDLNLAINSVNSGSGWDMVHSENLKLGGKVFRNLLCKLFNKIILHGYVPHSMLSGQIKPVIKNISGSKSDSENFRPVMSSSIIFKLLEYCLLPILTKHIDLNKRQFGFRKGASCCSTVTIFKEIIHSYNSEKSNVHCCMVDLSKAFDRVDAQLLVRKLKQTSVPPLICNLVGFMYSNTYVNVKFNDCQSRPWLVQRGVRQGSVLSPLLFCFYINEIIDKISEMNYGCLFTSLKFNILCYADDIALIAPSSFGLQQLIDRLCSLLTELDLKINKDKCAYIIFKKQRNITLNSKIYLLGSEVKRVSEFKYLGIFLSEDMTNSKDVDRVMGAFLKQFHGMYSKFSYTDIEVLRFLFKTYASSFYGIETWFNSFGTREIRSISVSYHKAVKKIAGLQVWDGNHEACEVVRVSLFKHLLAKRMICFFNSLINSDSDCITPFRYYFRFCSNFYRVISKLMIDEYGVVDFLTNPLCALLARIDYVQRNEPRLR